uniref:Myb-like domain-containing protein n=1 Tax=Ditylenchus dipsaci TaxID=166011 RepID=A0A915DZ91_9BILA
MGRAWIGRKKFKKLRIEGVDKREKVAVAEDHSKRAVDVNYAYDYIERREQTDSKIGDEVHMLSGIYSAHMLNYSKPSEPEAEDVGEQTERAMLRLPEDGGIFVDGIPFHHYVLSALKEKHIIRLKQNAPLYVSAATATEQLEEHRERIRFCQVNRFRPWMCKRLLDRTCVQVFRRCYILFHCANQALGDTRPWKRGDDKALIEMVETHSKGFEEIGIELKRTRFSCRTRYKKLKASEEDVSYGEWEPIEIAKFYKFLCDNMSRHPVLVATIPRYAYYEEQVQWDSEELAFLQRSIRQRQAKWEELKRKFCEAKERLRTDFIKEVEKAVIPDSTRILENVRVKKRTLKISAKQIACCIDALLAQQPDVLHMRHFNKELYWKSICFGLTTMEFADLLSEVKDPVKRVMHRISYILFACRFTGLFDTLPPDQDIIRVKLQIIAKVLRKEDKFKIKKRVLRKHIRHFISTNGWTPRKKIVFVDKSAKE